MADVNLTDVPEVFRLLEPHLVDAAVPEINSCIYFMRINSRRFYIGRTNNIQRRKREYGRKYGAKIKWAIPADVARLPDIEAALIYYFKPAANWQCPPPRPNYRDILKEYGLPGFEYRKNCR